MDRNPQTLNTEAGFPLGASSGGRERADAGEGATGGKTFPEHLQIEPFCSAVDRTRHKARLWPWLLRQKPFQRLKFFPDRSKAVEFSPVARSPRRLGRPPGGEFGGAGAGGRRGGGDRGYDFVFLPDVILEVAHVESHLMECSLTC